MKSVTKIEKRIFFEKTKPTCGWMENQEMNEDWVEEYAFKNVLDVCSKETTCMKRNILEISKLWKNIKKNLDNTKYNFPLVQTALISIIRDIRSLQGYNCTWFSNHYLMYFCNNN